MTARLNTRKKIKEQLYHLDKMNVYDADFDTTVRQVMAKLLQHIRHEEEEILPALCRASTPQDLRKWGENFLYLRKQVPTHPHPWAPDRPPLEVWLDQLVIPPLFW